MNCWNEKERFIFSFEWRQWVEWIDELPLHTFAALMNFGLLVIGFHSSSFQLNSTCLHSINFLYLSIKLTYLLFKEQFQSINERGMEMSWMGWKLITHCPLIKRKVYFSFIEGPANQSIPFHFIDWKTNQLNFSFQSNKTNQSLLLVCCLMKERRRKGWLKREKLNFFLFIGLRAPLKKKWN